MHNARRSSVSETRRYGRGTEADGGKEEKDVRREGRNNGERKRTIMMRFIESIVPGIQVHRHNRCVYISDTVERRYSIDFQFLDGAAARCIREYVRDTTRY